MDRKTSYFLSIIGFILYWILDKLIVHESIFQDNVNHGVNIRVILCLSMIHVNYGLILRENLLFSPLKISGKKSFYLRIPNVERLYLIMKGRKGIRIKANDWRDLGKNKNNNIY